MNEVLKRKEDMLKDIKTLCLIPSTLDESTAADNQPFGKACRDALDAMLEIGKRDGYEVCDVDGYAGHIDVGEGEESFGVLGHLDVVPALEEDGWTRSPFSPEVRDNKLFGRGSIDDKGPVVASLYAMKAIKDSCNISKRVRLILGLNEEKGWKCIDYYKEHEEYPVIGFSPDANFPAIFAEKGILSIELKNTFLIKGYEILEITTNNNAINVVPKYCSITLKLNLETESDFSKLEASKNNHINLTVLENNIIKIEAFGTAAHAAHPELGEML